MFREEAQRWQGQKQICYRLLAAGGFLVVALSVFRFVPVLNDSISPDPHYAQVLTRKLAQLTLQTEGPAYPVIVVSDEDDPCKPITLAKVIPAPQAIYYVLTYSERQRLSCFTIYVTPINGFEGLASDVVTLRPGQGTNYGRELMGPVLVVPFYRLLKVYTEPYLALLHWRSNPGLTLPTDFVAARNFHDPKIPWDRLPQFFGTEVGLAEARAELARTHNRLNLMLSGGIGLLALLMMALLALMWNLYRKFRQHCAAFDHAPGFKSFLTRDLGSITAEAAASFQQDQRELHDQQVMERARDEMRQRLLGTRDSVPDERERQRVEECLAKEDCDIERMRALWEELLQRARQRPPEERLEVLAASLRENCTDEEFDVCRADAFAIHQQAGFRQARDYLVRMHDQFRTRAKELEKAEREKSFEERAS